MLFHASLPMVPVVRFSAKAPSSEKPKTEKPKMTLSQINPQMDSMNRTPQPDVTQPGSLSGPDINHHPEVAKRREAHGKTQSTKKKGALALFLTALASLGGAVGLQLTAPDYPEGSSAYESYYRRAPKDPTQYPRGAGAIEQTDLALRAQFNRETPILPELKQMAEQDQTKKLSTGLQSVWLSSIDNASQETQKLTKQVIGGIFNVDRAGYYDSRYVLKNEYQPAFDKAVQDYMALNITRMGEKPEQEKAILRELNQSLLGKTYSKELVSYYNSLLDQSVVKAKSNYDTFVKDTAENEAFFADYKNAELKGAEANRNSLWLTLLGLGAGAGATGLAVASAKRKRTFQDALQKHLDNTLQQKIKWIHSQHVETLTPLEKSLMGFNIEEDIKIGKTSQARAMIALRDLGITRIGEKPTEELAILDKWVKEHFALSPNWEAQGRAMDAIEDYYDSLTKNGGYTVPYTRFVIALELFMNTSGLK
jgi:hypothetical protein